MEIGDIKPEVLGGYWVSVILTIESTKDVGFPFFIKKGQRITNENHYVAIANFRGGSAIIRKQEGVFGKWYIADTWHMNILAP